MNPCCGRITDVVCVVNDDEFNYQSSTITISARERTNILAGIRHRIYYMRPLEIYQINYLSTVGELTTDELISLIVLYNDAVTFLISRLNSR
jgi:hypothetical protein